jgi:hypothetical protein
MFNIVGGRAAGRRKLPSKNALWVPVFRVTQQRFFRQGKLFATIGEGLR